MQLSSEFAAQRGILREVQQQVQAYREAGKMEAAERLKDQLQLAEVRLFFVSFILGLYNPLDYCYT